MSWKWVAIGGAGLVAGLGVVFLFLAWIAPILLLTSGTPTTTPLAVSPPPVAAALSTASKYSGPPNQVAQAQISSTPTSSTEAESRKKQLMEVRDAMRAEFAKSGGAAFEIQGENQNGGAADTASTAERADAATILRQLDAQIGAAMEAIDANPSQIDQKAGAMASEKPDGRPRRHRKRH